MPEADDTRSPCPCHADERGDPSTAKRPVRVYRIEFDETRRPHGWDFAMADANPRFAMWGQSGDGYHEPTDSYICTDKHGEPIWSPPRRRNYLSAAPAYRVAQLLTDLGVPCVVLRSEPVTFQWPEPEWRLYVCATCKTEHHVTRNNAVPPLPWPEPKGWTCWFCVELVNGGEV